MDDTSFDFLERANPSFRKKIDPMRTSVSVIMDKYKRHIKETTEAERKSPSEFLKQDFILNMFAEDSGCSEDILWAMVEWSKI